MACVCGCSKFMVHWSAAAYTQGHLDLLEKILDENMITVEP